MLVVVCRCSSALYVRLIFDDVVLWRSYSRRHVTYLEAGVDACIRKLLERTELQHGRLLVSLSSLDVDHSAASPNNVTLYETISDKTISDKTINVSRWTRLLVSHAFAYITASKEGLTESELEDVLSLDEQVVDFFKQTCMLKQ